MKKKNIITYFMLPLVIFSIFGLIEVPKSKAKYIKEDDFMYQKASLSRLSWLNSDAHNKLNINYDTRSTYRNAYIDVTFTPNNIMYDDDVGDQYVVTIRNNGNNNCQIVDGSAYSENSIANDNGGYGSSVTFTYDGVVNPTDTLGFKLKCSVDNSEINILSYGITITETITNATRGDNQPFTYISLDKNVIADDYYIEGVREIPAADAYYAGSIAAMHDYYDANVKSTILKVDADTIWQLGLQEYFNTVFAVNASNSAMLTNKDNLKGFTFNVDDDGNVTYTFDSTYLGYAMSHYTYNHNNNTALGQNKFAFSDYNNLTTARKEEIFRYYLATYASDTIKAYNPDSIIQYINRYGGMNALFNNTIPNIYFTADTENYIADFGYVTFSDSIIEAIENASNPNYSKVTNFDKTKEQMWNVFKPEFTRDTTIPALLRVNIANKTNGHGTEIYDSLTRYDSSVDPTTATAFSDFIFENDDTTNLIFNIYAPAEGTHTYYKYYILTAGTEIMLALPDGVSDQNAIDAINNIGKKLHGDSTAEITSLGTPTSTETVEGVEHSYYSVVHDYGTVGYDVYTETRAEASATYSIKYIKYTLQ